MERDESRSHENSRSECFKGSKGVGAPGVHGKEVTGREELSWAMEKTGEETSFLVKDGRGWRDELGRVGKGGDGIEMIHVDSDLRRGARRGNGLGTG